MLLALLALGVVAAALVAPMIVRAGMRWNEVRADRRERMRRRARRREMRDPGRERRAEQRARELLRSCVNDEEWAMYRDLGFIRVYGGLAVEGPGRLTAQLRRRRDPRSGRDSAQPAYAYLIYPHKPIVAYVPATG